jgi:uncharacterized protein YaiI (UPF0178 family)
MLRKKPQETPKNKTGRVFSSNFTKPNVSFAAALRDRTQQQRQQEEVTRGPEPQKLRRKETYQSVPATIVNTEPQDKACRNTSSINSYKTYI